MPDRAPRLFRMSLGLLGAGAVALLVVVGGSLWLANTTRESAVRVSEASITRLHALRLQSMVLNAETGQRGYLLSGNPAYLAPFTRAQAQISGEIDALSEALAEEGRHDELADTATLVRNKLVELDQTVALAREGRTDEAIAIVKSNRGKDAMDVLRQRLGAISVDADQRVKSETKMMLSRSRALAVVTLGGGVLVVVFVTIAGLGAWRYTQELTRAQGEVRALNADLERRVQTRTADLVRANEEIQRYAYIVSHDLRAPLVNIMGFTSELEEGVASVGRYFDAAPEARTPALTDEARRAAGEDMPEAIRFVRSSTRKMDALINAILKISREGGRVLVPEPLDLKALVERQLAAVQHQIETGGVTVTLAGAWPQIVSDRLALDQVFGNLIDNALKYLRPGVPGRIDVTARDLGSRVEVAIADNGRGIGEQDFVRIFELFRRSGVQDRPGEGIGLAHVQALVRRLGGQISVESRLNEGSVFRIALPKAVAAQSEGVGA